MLPNQRLHVVFGIDNAFTSDDEDYTARFIADASKAISLSSNCWMDLSMMVRKAARESIGSVAAAAGGCSGGSARVHLTSLVQVLTMRVVLRVLFGMTTSLLESRLVDLATAINDTWVSSKNKDMRTEMPMFEDNSHLQKCLLRIFEPWSRPRENPLNLLLPGFETMWRVVLRAFLEVQYGHGSNMEWRNTIAAFGGNPTTMQFLARNGGQEVSARSLIHEAFRLYPPTRRVYRAFQGSPSPGSECAVEILPGDIEAAHTEPRIWGPDAGVFDPHRWKILTREQRKAFCPFGCPPFVCPAQGSFGPRAVGLIVGVLVAVLEDWVLETDITELGYGSRLDNDRNAYRDLFLVRKST